MRFYRLLLLRALCVMLVFSAVIPYAVFAEENQNENQKIVRVGWYESAFHRTDQFGRRSGYGYEYQQRIATYTGWTYEYVEGSWSELLEKLIAGEIDLLSDVSYTEERAEKVLYSSEAMGSEDYYVYISSDNTEIRPDDFSAFNGKRAGVNKNSIQEQFFREWTQKHDVHPEIIELSVKTPEMLEMLNQGEIDMLVTLDTYGNSEGIVPVCKVGSAESYFGINRNRPDLKKELDTAMFHILESNRDFNQQLADKFNRAGSVNSFLSPEEKEWFDGHGAIRVGYRKDSLPFCDLNEQTNSVTGSLADFLEFAKTCQKNAELSFETKAYGTTTEALHALSAGEIDCVFPVNLSSYDGEQIGLIVSDPFVKTGMYVAVRTEDHLGVSPDRMMTVALLKDHDNHENFLKDYFPDWRTKYFESNEDSFKAVSSGEADCTLVSSHRINRVSDLCLKNKLTTLFTGETMNLCFAMRREDNKLYSIFNKVLRLFPDTTINSSLTNYSFRDERVTFFEYLRDNVAYFAVAVSAVIIIILLLLVRNMKTVARVNEGRRLISETERDTLTQLYNWNFFLAYANRICREHPEKPMDAAVINIDRFHSVNYLHGRDFGDRVLCAIGDEIKSFIDEAGGIACRFDADRFNMYCPMREDWQKVLEDFQTKLDSISQNANIRLRMGVKPWEKGLEPLPQFDRARTACNMIRGDFKTKVMIYDSEMGRREEREQRLLNDLRHGLEEKQFEVWYQPKYYIQCDSPRLSSAEALVRWRHPELGLIYPGEFIPLLEKDGQISALDHYVWEEAARQIDEWRGHCGQTIPVSVNLSRVDVFDPGLMAVLDEIISKYNLECGSLKLEVTESAYTENAEYLIRVIEQLRIKGYEIEMDDFGSGYSSLNMLSSMPVDILKMDMKFVQNIERNEQDLHLVELILDIAQYLKVPVVAEGVETKNQLKLLKDAGCDIVQGFYFSCPLPADEFERKILGTA